MNFPTKALLDVLLYLRRDPSAPSLFTVIGDVTVLLYYVVNNHLLGEHHPNSKKIHLVWGDEKYASRLEALLTDKSVDADVYNVLTNLLHALLVRPVALRGTPTPTVSRLVQVEEISLS